MRARRASDRAAAGAELASHSAAAARRAWRRVRTAAGSLRPPGEAARSS